MESILILNANTADTLIAGALLLGATTQRTLSMGGKFQGEIPKQTEAASQNVSCPQSGSRLTFWPVYWKSIFAWSAALRAAGSTVPGVQTLETEHKQNVLFACRYLNDEKTSCTFVKPAFYVILADTLSHCFWSSLSRSPSVLLISALPSQN